MRTTQLLISLLLCTLVGTAQKAVTIDSRFKNSFESHIKGLYKELSLGGDFGFCVVDKSGVVYTYMRGHKASRQKLSLQTPFYLASHTKAMTGTLLKLLEKQGQIHLDSSLGKYLPELHFNYAINPNTISIKHLLSHTHGISNNIVTWKTAYLGYSGGNAELIADFNRYSSFDTTRTFTYSNIGPILACMVVEKLTGSSWKKLMEQHLFQPLHMNHTSGFIEDYLVKKLLPTTYKQTGSHTSIGFYKTTPTLHAAGGIISTLSDLSNWIVFNLNSGNFQNAALLSDADFKDIIDPVAQQNVTYFVYKRYGYSLGWDLAQYNRESLVHRFGGFAGSNIHISFLPEKGIGIIAFTNEEKAYRLPHISANLAYNLLLQKPNATLLFSQEKELYQAALNKKNETTTTEAPCPFRPDISGKYINKAGWPPISLKQSQNKLWIQWEQALAPIIITKCESQAITISADFGSFQREFQLLFTKDKPISLHSGSLVFTRL